MAASIQKHQKKQKSANCASKLALKNNQPNINQPELTLWRAIPSRTQSPSATCATSHLNLVETRLHVTNAFKRISFPYRSLRGTRYVRAAPTDDKSFRAVPHFACRPPVNVAATRCVLFPCKANSCLKSPFLN